MYDNNNNLFENYHEKNSQRKKNFSFFNLNNLNEKENFEIFDNFCAPNFHNNEKNDTDLEDYYYVENSLNNNKKNECELLGRKKLSNLNFDGNDKENISDIYKEDLKEKEKIWDFSNNDINNDMKVFLLINFIFFYLEIVSFIFFLNPKIKTLDQIIP